MINGWGLVRLVDVSHPWLLRFHQRPTGVNAARRSPGIRGPVPVQPVSGRRLPGRLGEEPGQRNPVRAALLALPLLCFSPSPVCLTLRSVTFALEYCHGSRLVISLFTSGRQDLLKSEVRYPSIWWKTWSFVLVFARVLCSLFLLYVFRFCWGLRWGNPRRVSYEICGRIMVKNAWFSRIFGASCRLSVFPPWMPRGKTGWLDDLFLCSFSVRFVLSGVFLLRLSRVMMSSSLDLGCLPHSDV